MWFPIGSTTLPLSLFLIMGFSASFMFGWNFYFPSHAEQLTWRIFSVYHMAFSLYGAGYYSVEAWKAVRRSGQEELPSTTIELIDPEAQQLRGENRGSEKRPRDFISGWMNTFRSWRNISPDQDPGMAVPLKVIAPTTIICGLYAACRMYFYIEDFVSLREQPHGIYLTGNKFLPFIVNPV
ncbi:uncharacterized protein ColSpa_06342 [Colletotrichum spaethianum]|uniref:Uncharacterized protein n=1 Tax=Colletotrichum spaethianum TaxID=700344 RepID=A0AA37P6D8_9PEZI|nr:uncharacterized protein ColSpa_06342 [Colletotrichum spaethianum]GKT46161.1 hypothetical protein ColSpa_06342 [Colletotrichum spaethianum]